MNLYADRLHPFELIAQGNADARQVGMAVGVAIAVLVSAGLPIVVGVTKQQLALGFIGGFLAGGIALLLGCLGGLPVALVFVVIILSVSASEPNRRRSARRRRRRRYEDVDDEDDEEDEDDRRRRRRRRRDD